MNKTPKSPSSNTKFYISKQAIRFTGSQIIAKTQSKKTYRQATLAPETITDFSHLSTDPAIKEITSGWSPGQGVTICIPESSILTRLVEITSPVQEMHETVLWQVQNYLPLPPEQMIIDWQIIKEEAPITTLQVVAAPRAPLEQYVDVLRSHGVKVVDIDTPSMVLCRIISTQELPGLIIEAEAESVLVVSNQKNVIDLVSVVSEVDNVAAVATQMLNYYHKKNNLEITHVYVIGSLAEQVASALKLSFPAKILPSSQTAFIDSVASKPVAPPQDRQTINLVPTQYHIDYTSVSNSNGRKRIFSLSAWALLLLNFLAAYFIFLAWQAYSNSRPVAPPAADLQALSEQFHKSEAQINLINQSRARRSAFHAIQAVNQSLPPQITISSMRFVLATESLVVVGVAPNQADVFAFQSALDESEVFNEVRLPLSVFEQRQPVPFTITLNLQSSNQ